MLSNSKNILFLTKNRSMILTALIMCLFTGGVSQKGSAIVIGSIKLFLLESAAIKNAEKMEGCTVCALCTAGFVGGGALIAAGVYGACFAGVSTTKALCCAGCQDACCQCCCTPYACSITSKMKTYDPLIDQSHLDYAASPQAEEDLDNALQHIHFLRKEDKNTILDEVMQVLDLWSDKGLNSSDSKVEIQKKDDNDEAIALDIKLSKKKLTEILTQSKHDYTQQQTEQIFSILSY